jgi:5,6-dimethylbenzimidazole synthase
MNGAFPDVWKRGLYEAIARRRDIRSFRPDPIRDEVLARILSAAHQAGSVGFMQPWNFIVIEDQELRARIRAHVEKERLRAAEGFEQERRDRYLSLKLEGILEAPLNLCVTCDRERFGPAVIGRNTIQDTDVYSTCAAIQNLWLAARAEGIGVGWVSILRPDELRRLLVIPEHVIPVGYLCLGYVEHFPERPMLETIGWLPRTALSELVFFDRWGEAPPPTLLDALREQNASEKTTVDALAEVPTGRRERRGLLVIYTGHGKGKTTAALGLVFRALGRGFRVAVVQFIKGKWKTGERLFAAGLPDLDFHVMGRGFTWESDDLSRDRGAAREAWEMAKAFMNGGEHDIVVLDELTYCVHYGFVSLDELLKALQDRPAHVHVVVTGRNAPEELQALADLVTEMKSVKHPFEHGARAQPGIDF